MPCGDTCLLRPNEASPLPSGQVVEFEQGSEVTYNTMIKVASYAGDVDRALAVLDDMAAAGFAPTAAVWGSLLVACGKVSLP